MNLPSSALSEARALQNSGQWEAALAVYETVFERSVRDQDVTLMLSTLRQLGYAQQLRGHVDLAADYLELALTLAEINGDYGETARALNGLGTIYQYSGQIGLAEATYDAAHLAAKSAADRLALGDIEQNLGTLSSLRSQNDRAKSHYQAGLAHYREIRYERGIAQVLHNLGILYLDLGELGEAEVCMEGALQIFLGVDDQPNAAAAYLNRAGAYIQAGSVEQARECCDSAFELACALDDNRLQAECHKYYGKLLCSTSRFRLAITHLQTAVAMAREYSAPLTEAESLRELGLALRALNHNAEALECLNRSHSLFTELQAKDDQTRVSISLARLEQDFQEIVEYWSESIEQKDSYTKGHCQRVADYACLLARSVGISEQDLVWFRMGAFLHDVGKTEVPESILHKRDILTATEREIVERHVVDGADLLATISFPWDIRPMIRSHHERWDGKGYPDGLSGEAIPLAARILKLADVFDALTTSRSYRHRLTAQDALKLMREDASAFDPALFEQFEKIFPKFALMVNPTSELMTASF